MTTRFLELVPTGAESGVGVLVLPGAGWGASSLASACAPWVAAGHRVLLCDPEGTIANPGAYTHAALDADLDARLESWSPRRRIVLAHSMGARASARLAARDEHVEQVWVAPIVDSARCFAHLYEGPGVDELTTVLFERPRTALEAAACGVLASRDWLEPPSVRSLAERLGLPSRGAVRVPSVGVFLRELVEPGYRLGSLDARGLRALFIPRGDAWAPSAEQEAFAASVSVPVQVLHAGRGHANAGGWSEVLQRVLELVQA